MNHPLMSPDEASLIYFEENFHVPKPYYPFVRSTPVMDTPECEESQPLLGQKQPPEEVTTPWQETGRLAKKWFPLAVALLHQRLFQAIVVLLCIAPGRLERNVASYGFMFATLTGTLVAIGGPAPLDGLAALSTATTDRAPLIRLIQQTTIITMGIFLTVVTPLWICAEQILLALGQEHDFAAATGLFLRIMIPGGSLLMIVESLKRYLQAQGLSYPVMAMSLASCVVGCLLTWAITRLTGAGVYSAAIGFDLYQALHILFLFRVLRANTPLEELFRTTKHDLLQGLFSTLGQSLASIVALGAEWGCKMIALLAASNADPVVVGARAIAMSWDVALTMIPLGLDIAVTHQVKCHLAQGDGVKARRVIVPSLLFSACIGTAWFAGMVILAYHLSPTAGDIDINGALASKLLQLVGIFYVLTLLNHALNGILRGSGKVFAAAFWTTVAYFSMGISTACMFYFQKQWGMMGLWYGSILGALGTMAHIAPLIVFTRWDTLAKTMMQKIESL